MNRYQSEDEIENVVRGFETCATSGDDFHHAEHLVVAVWYVHRMNRDAALDSMRAGLFRFLEHHGVERGKYSETVTAFYIDKIVEKLNEMGPEVSVVEKCNAVLAADFRGLKMD